MVLEYLAVSGIQLQIPLHTLGIAQVQFVDVTAILLL